MANEVSDKMTTDVQDKLAKIANGVGDHTTRLDERKPSTAIKMKCSNTFHVLTPHTPGA